MAEKKPDKAYPSQFDKVKEITDKLEAGIQALFESETFKNYLKTLSKFHDYSLNNTILIAMQKPDATLVAGYTAWQKNFGRQVLKGESGIRILAPTPYKKQMEVDRVDPVTKQPILNPDGSTAKDLKEIMVPAFKVVNVFDVSQTDGKPLPSIGVDELEGNVTNYELFFEALKRACPVRVDFEQIPSGAKGYYHTVEERIALQEGMSEVQTVKTMIHEMAHQKLHSIDPKDLPPEEPRLTRNAKEVEAEAIAYTVSQHYGIETSDYSFAYIAGWSKDKDTPELKASLDRIRQAANEMIMAIDDHVFYLQQEWGIETKPKTAEQPAPELQENGRYRYYSTQRPVDIGTFPKPADNKPVEIHNYDSRIPVENGTMLAWGYLEYAKPLTEKEASDYELKPAPARTTRDETLSSQEEKPSVLMELAEKKGKVTRKAPSKLTHRKKEETR
jgi:antirestriction protein ArdC